MKRILTIYLLALKVVVINPKTRRMSIGMILSALLISIGIAAYIVVISIFDGTQVNLEKMVFNIKPEISVLKKEKTEKQDVLQNSFFSNDDGQAVGDDSVLKKEVGDIRVARNTGVMPGDDWLRKVEKTEPYDDNNTFSLEDSRYVIQAAEKYEFVKNACPVIIDSTDIIFRSDSGTQKKYPVIVIGLDWVKCADVLGAGSLLAEEEKKELQDGSLTVLSNELQNALPDSFGDNMSVFVKQRDDQELSNRVQIDSIKHVQLGFGGFGSNVLLTNIERARKLLDLPDGNVNFIALKTDDKYREDEYVKMLEESIDRPYHVVSWKTQGLESQFLSLYMLRSINAVVIGSLIFVSLFSLKSSLMVLLAGKKQQMNVLRALGLADFHIKAAVVVAGIIVGIAGSAVGCIAGVFLADYLSKAQLSSINEFLGLDSYPVLITFESLSMVCLFTLLMSSVFAFFPARKMTVDAIVSGLKK